MMLPSIPAGSDRLRCTNRVPAPNDIIRRAVLSRLEWRPAANGA